MQRTLDIQRTPHRIDGTRELGQEPIPSGEVHQLTTVLPHKQLNLLLVRTQGTDRVVLVFRDESGVARDIAHEDGGQAVLFALYVDWPVAVLRHSSNTLRPNVTANSLVSLWLWRVPGSPPKTLS